MKKHSLIFGVVVAVTAILVAVLFTNKSGPDFTGGSESPNDDTLTIAVDRIRKNPYDNSFYQLIKNTIQVQTSIGQISQNEEKSLLTALELAKQSALTISINNWFSERCGRGDIRGVVEVAEETSNPIRDLIVAVNTYKKYKATLSFKNRLDQVLRSEWNEAVAFGLISEYDEQISGQPFQMCSTIQQLRANIGEQVNEYKMFYEDQPAMFNSSNYSPGQIESYYTMYPRKLDELRKYKFYYELYSYIVD